MLLLCWFSFADDEQRRRRQGDRRWTLDAFAERHGISGEFFFIDFIFIADHHVHHVHHVELALGLWPVCFLFSLSGVSFYLVFFYLVS